MVETLTPSRSRTAETYVALRNMIVGAQYRPGDHLRIAKIAAEHGVNPSAVREAFSRLTSEGLVLSLPQRGFIVAPVSRKDLIDLTEVRITVESTCLRQSIELGDVEWEATLMAVTHKLAAASVALKGPRDAPERLKWHRLHEQFHDVLVAACPNEQWLQMRRQLYVSSERYRRLSGPFAEVDRDIQAEHAAICEAALARDPDSAVNLMRDHLQTTTDILLNSKIAVDLPDV
jgi:GntR family transcriptional regulator, carbon starvation induced regulator